MGSDALDRNPPSPSSRLPIDTTIRIGRPELGQFFSLPRHFQRLGRLGCDPPADTLGVRQFQQTNASETPLISARSPRWPCPLPMSRFNVSEGDTTMSTEKSSGYRIGYA